MDNQEFKVCKKCQCEFPAKIIDKYNGYCKNCKKSYEKNKKNTNKYIMIISIIIIIVVGLLIFMNWNNKRNMEVARSEFLERLEENMKDVYEDETSVEYGLTNVTYEIVNISKVDDRYEIRINLNCTSSKELTDTEKSLLAYAVEDYVPDSFEASNGYTVTVRNSQGGYYLMINTSVDDELIHSSSQNAKNIESTQITDDEEAYAVAVAQEEIRELLYLPSSAKFPASFDEYKITKSGDSYTVSSYVDADNLFGANIRQYYTVEFTMTGSETYIVDDIYLQDN